METEIQQPKTPDINLLRALVDLRERTLQKSRIAFGNRLAAIERGDDHADEQTKKMLEKWNLLFNDLEAQAEDDIAGLIGDDPLVQELTQLKGIGKTLASKLVAMINFETAGTVSALWRYAGYGTVFKAYKFSCGDESPEYEGLPETETDPEVVQCPVCHQTVRIVQRVNGRERLVRGEKAHYNKRLKKDCYLIALSFMRSNSPYRRIYDSQKAVYQAKHPDWEKARIHMASLRIMTKVFLSHVWLRGRVLHNLPTRSIYAVDKLEHQSMYTPEEFGWAALALPEAISTE